MKNENKWKCPDPNCKDWDSRPEPCKHLEQVLKNSVEGSKSLGTNIKIPKTQRAGTKAVDREAFREYLVRGFEDDLSDSKFSLKNRAVHKKLESLGLETNHIKAYTMRETKHPWEEIASRLGIPKTSVQRMVKKVEKLLEAIKSKGNISA